MPRKAKAKKVEAVKSVLPSSVEEKTVRGLADPSTLKEKRVPTFEEKRIESRKLLEQPVPPGMAYFESPEGYVMIGEAKNGTIWCRDSNDGKGQWINQRR